MEGYLEPLDDEQIGAPGVEFVNHMMGNNTAGVHPLIEKGFKEVMSTGTLCGSPTMGVRVVLTDGAAHAVDSNELSFKAAAGAFKQAKAAGPLIPEPVMSVEVSVPSEFQATVGMIRSGRARSSAWRALSM